MITNITLHAVCFPSENMVVREIEGEVIIVPLTLSIGEGYEDLYTLNPTGQAIWQKLDGQHSLQAVTAGLADEFDAPLSEIETDVLNFASELVRREILSVASLNSSGFMQNLDRLHTLAAQPAASLVTASLDIGRVLAGRDGVTFRAQGACMYPTVRSGDVLRIQPCRATDLALGDLAVCRLPGFLFCHRVIAKGLLDGRAFVVTRPDRASSGGDEPTFDDNLLGRVIAIQRAGRSVPLTQTRYAWPARLYFAARLACIESQPRLMAWLTIALTRAQTFRLYGLIARAWRPRLSYTLRVPFTPALGAGVYRPFDPSDFEAWAPQQGQTLKTWTLLLHVGGAREPAAWVTFTRQPGQPWRVAETYVRIRCRGLGLEVPLKQRADQILARIA